MSSGILEGLVAQICAINEKQDAILAALNSGQPPSPIEVKVEDNVVPLNPTTPQEVSEGSGLFDDGGYEWDERIHAGTKTKTVKGLWKKVKGCDKDLYDKIMAEQTVRLSSPESDAADINAEAPPVPTATKKAAPPSPPVAVVTPSEALKQKVMESINVLTSKYGVDYDLIISEFPDNAKDFNSIPATKHEDVALQMKTWCDWLNVCSEEDSKIESLGDQAGLDGMQVIYNHYNGATSVNQILPSNLSVVYDSLKDYRAAWENL